MELNELGWVCMEYGLWTVVMRLHWIRFLWLSLLSAFCEKPKIHWKCIATKVLALYYFIFRSIFSLYFFSVEFRRITIFQNDNKVKEEIEIIVYFTCVSPLLLLLFFLFLFVCFNVCICFVLLFYVCASVSRMSHQNGLLLVVVSLPININNWLWHCALGSVSCATHFLCTVGIFLLSWMSHFSFVVCF